MSDHFDGPRMLAERSAELAKMVATGNVKSAVASLSEAAQTAFLQAANASFNSGLRLAVLVAAVVAIFGAVSAFVLVRDRDRSDCAHNPKTPKKASAYLSTVIRHLRSLYERTIQNQALLIPCMKMILRADQNPCRDVAVLRLYIRIHTSIQQRPKSNFVDA